MALCALDELQRAADNEKVLKRVEKVSDNTIIISWVYVCSNKSFAIELELAMHERD